MDGFWSHAGEIIAEAGKSPLNLIALALLCSMFVAYVFFRTSASWVKLSTYLGLLLFLGVAVIAMAVISVMSSVTVQQVARNAPPNPRLDNYTALPSPPPTALQPVPSNRQTAAIGMEALAGDYWGVSKNGLNYGKMLFRLPSITSTGSARIQISESDGLEGDCNLNGAIISNGNTYASGVCQDRAGLYNSRIQAQFIGPGHLHGLFYITPRPGTPSQPQVEEFDVQR